MTNDLGQKACGKWKQHRGKQITSARKALRIITKVGQQAISSPRASVVGMDAEGCQLAHHLIVTACSQRFHHGTCQHLPIHAVSSHHNQELSGGGHFLQALPGDPVECQRLKSARASNNTDSTVLLLAAVLYGYRMLFTLQYTSKDTYIGETFPEEFLNEPTLCNA